MVDLPDKSTSCRDISHEIICSIVCYPPCFRHGPWVVRPRERGPDPGFRFGNHERLRPRGTGQSRSTRYGKGSCISRDFSLPKFSLLPAASATHFSADYLRIRQRYLNFFCYGGLSASQLNLKPQARPGSLDPGMVSQITFGDQTVYMGQALLAFAGEARVLKSHGIDPCAVRGTRGGHSCRFRPS